MPRKEDRSNLVYYILYILIALMFLKLFRMIPGSPDEVVNVALSITGVVLVVLTLFQQWLSSRFRSLEIAVDAIAEGTRSMENRLTALQHGLENVKLTERLTRLEAKLEKE